jgi:ribosomal protein S18 acetylase RimI-like enzyme
VDAITKSRVQSYLKNIQYKYRIETNASIIQLDQATGLQYTQKTQQPWPRKFDYQLEFFAMDVSPGAVDAAIGAFLKNNPQEYVLTVFSQNLNALIPTYKSLGYQHAWSNTIMEHKLSMHAISLNLDPDIELFSVQNSADVSAINAMGADYPTCIQGLNDKHIFNFYAKYNNEIGAKAQGIIFDSKYIYLADMFTHPQFRRKGLSAALLQKLHQVAQLNGCSHSILVPSRMTREIELYQKFLYTEVVSMALLVPMFSPDPL